MEFFADRRLRTRARPTLLEPIGQNQRQRLRLLAIGSLSAVRARELGSRSAPPARQSCGLLDRLTLVPGCVQPATRKAGIGPAIHCLAETDSSTNPSYGGAPPYAQDKLARVSAPEALRQRESVAPYSRWLHART